VKRGEWARAFLSALGNSTPDAKTINFVASWTLGENTRAAYNPLATTQPMESATDFNWVGVKDYTSHQQGIDATVKTLENGYYPHVLHGLQTNDPEEAVNAVELGIWGTGLGFTTLWRAGDHTQEDLLSHTGGTSSGGDFGGGGFDVGPIALLNPASAAAEELTSPDASKDIARNVSFIALGGLMLFIAIALAIRTYVPTQQIVKTIAAVA